MPTPKPYFQAARSSKPVGEAGGLSRRRASSLNTLPRHGVTTPVGGQSVSAADFDVRRRVLDRQANCAKLRASCPFGRSALPQTSGGDVVSLAGQRLEPRRQQILGGHGIAVVLGSSPSNRDPLRLQRRFDPFGEDVGLAGIEARG